MSERIYQVVIGVLVLVVLVGGWMMIAGKRGNSAQTGSASTSTVSSSDVSDDEEQVSQTAGPSMAEPSTAASGEVVMVADQPSGGVVMADTVTLTKRGWVAIEDDREWVMGAARLEAGTHEDVEIELLRGTEKGATYKAILFADDGDGQFDLHKDIVIKNSDGSTLSAAFITK